MRRGEAPSAVETQEAEGAGALSLGQRFFNLRTALTFLLAAAILALIFYQFDIDLGAVVALMGESQAGPLALAFAAFYLTLPLRALRWRVLLLNAQEGQEAAVRPLGLVPMTEILLLGWFANCIVPAKLGDAYRSYLVKRGSGASFSRTLGTVVTERALDVVTMVALLGLAAMLVWRQGRMGQTLALLQGGALLLVLVVGGMLLLRFGGPKATPWLPKRFQDPYGRLLQGVLGSQRQMPLLLGLSLSIWLLEASRLYLVVQAQGLSLSWGLILFAALANAFLTTLPITPGGLGFVEGGIVAVLLTAVGTEQAVSLALLDRIVSYWSLIVAGFLLFLVSRRR